MPWYKIPPNIFMYLFVPLYSLFFCATFRARNDARHKAGYRGMPPMFGKKTEIALCMSYPTIDFPTIPHKRLVCCGPITLDAKPLPEVDTEMYMWTKKRPTILIALGSMIATDETCANVIMSSLQVLLGRRPDVQVLWKLKKWGDFELKGVEDIGDRLRVVPWLKADPLATRITRHCGMSRLQSKGY
jgi:hypothetical protein